MREPAIINYLLVTQ